MVSTRGKILVSAGEDRAVFHYRLGVVRLDILHGRHCVSVVRWNDFPEAIQAAEGHTPELYPVAESNPPDVFRVR